MEAEHRMFQFVVLSLVGVYFVSNNSNTTTTPDVHKEQSRIHSNSRSILDQIKILPKKKTTIPIIDQVNPNNENSALDRLVEAVQKFCNNVLSTIMMYNVIRLFWLLQYVLFDEYIYGYIAAEMQLNKKTLILIFLLNLVFYNFSNIYLLYLGMLVYYCFYGRRHIRELFNEI